MALKKDSISEILAEAKEAAEDLARCGSVGARNRVLVLCGLLGNIKVPVEREAEVVEAIGEIETAVKGEISKKFFEILIEKIRL